jgi:uncharacterized protein (DUF1697 family)
VAVVAQQIALLRAINLGPSRRIAMAELRALLSGLGYGAVRTHLASGNILLESNAAPGELARELEQHLADAFKLDVPVVVRSREELADVVTRNPLGRVASADPRRYQVTFLSHAPPAELVARIDAAAIAPERVVVSAREVFAWHPDGIIGSPLAKLLAGPRLGVTATARNWNTVTALLRLADARQLAAPG